MQPTAAQWTQASIDLRDFWNVFKSAFSAEEVDPDIHAPMRGVTFTHATPLSHTMPSTGDERIVAIEGFVLDKTAQQKVREHGMTPETGAVMVGHDMPEDFAQKLAAGLQAMGLNAIIVEEHNDSGTQTGVFVDIMQPNFHTAMRDLQLRMNQGQPYLINHTSEAKRLLDILSEQHENFRSLEGVVLSLDNMPEHAEAAVHAALTEHIIACVEQELALRHMITPKRFCDIMDATYEAGTAYHTLLRQADASICADDSARSALMSDCQSIDTEAYKRSLLEKFRNIAGLALDSSPNAPQDRPR